LLTKRDLIEGQDEREQKNGQVQAAKRKSHQNLHEMIYKGTGKRSDYLS
jgi:hypothetical protein